MSNNEITSFDIIAPMDFTLTTNGSLYTNLKKEVHLVQGELIDYSSEDSEDPYISGEFRLYFDDSWKVEEDGFIYTDEKFCERLVEYFATIGVTNDIWYSEYGMQGNDFISFDVDESFMRSFYKYAAQKGM